MKVNINEKKQNNEIPLISIDISISDDEKATICIMDDDIIEEKIQKFCIQNNLSDFDKELITKKIMQQLEIQINELEQKKINKNNSLNSLKNSFKNNKKLINVIENSDNKNNNNFNNDFDFNKENNINYINHYNIDSHCSQNSQKLISNVNTYKNNNYSNNNNNTIESNKKKIKKRNENHNVPIKQISTGQTIYYYSNNENHNSKNSYYYNNNNTLKNLIEKTKGPELLYLKYKDQIHKKEAERNKILKEIEEENKKIFLFKPTISENSQIIMKNKYNSNEKIENRLINYGIKKKEKDLKLIAQKQFEDEINNSFRPNISNKNNKYKNKIRKKTIEKLSKSFIINSNNNNNEISINNKRNKSVGNKNKNNFSKTKENKKEKKTFIFHNKIPKPQYKPEKNIHDLLYLESKLPKENKQIKIEKENFKKNCYFKPKINKSFIIERNETKEEFIERLYKNHNSNNNNKIKSVKFNSNNKKNSFIPKINLRSKNLSQKNLKINYEKIIDKNSKEKNEINFNQNHNKKIFLEHTTELILKMKIEKYKEIFNLLDSNKNGFISHNKIKISDLNSDLLLILTPIFEELQNNKNLKMNFKEFCIKSDKFLSKLIFKNE